MKTSASPLASFLNSLPFSICPTCHQTTRYMTPPEKAACPFCGPIPCVSCGDQADVINDAEMAADLCNPCREKFGV